MKKNQIHGKKFLVKLRTSLHLILHFSLPFRLCGLGENVSHKILWDISIQTERVIETQRPNLIVTDKKSYMNQIIDFALPHDARVDIKETEKIEKDQYLSWEL